MNEKRRASLRALVERGTAISDYPPEPFVPVLAHFEAFSCMAYLDDKGVWRSRFDNQPVAGRLVAWEQV